MQTKGCSVWIRTIFGRSRKVDALIFFFSGGPRAETSFFFLSSSTSTVLVEKRTHFSPSSSSFSNLLTLFALSLSLSPSLGEFCQLLFWQQFSRFTSPRKRGKKEKAKMLCKHGRKRRKKRENQGGKNLNFFSFSPLSNIPGEKMTELLSYPLFFPLGTP